MTEIILTVLGVIVGFFAGAGLMYIVTLGDD